MAESKEELKSHLIRVEEESETAGLKLNIQKMKIMASDPITLWQIDGGKVTDLIFLGSKITVDSHEIKRRLLLGRKAIVNLDSGSVLKNRDITLPTKICVVKAMVFPVIMYGCEKWTIKKAECQKTDAFKLMLENSLESPLARSNQSVLKEINPEYSLEGLMLTLKLKLKLKLQYFGHMMQRADSLENTLMLGKVEGRRRRE